jgi:hypothetical protein
MTTSQQAMDRQYVESKWEWFVCWPPHALGDSEGFVTFWHVRVADKQVDQWHDFTGDTEAETWSAAAEFTRGVEREIGFLQAEIDLVCETRLATAGVDYSRWTRILTRLNLMLEERLKGWRL